MVIACAGVVLKRVTLEVGRLSRESTGREVSISPPSCLKWAAIARVIAWEPPLASGHPPVWAAPQKIRARAEVDRKSTRLNSSHVAISYAVFCLKKKTHDTDVCQPG